MFQCKMAITCEKFKKLLRGYGPAKIVITFHALKQATLRDISESDIKENIINPERLCYVEEQETREAAEKKYNCLFEYSKFFHHRYILVLSENCIVCTVIAVNRQVPKREAKQK